MKYTLASEGLKFIIGLLILTIVLFFFSKGLSGFFLVLTLFVVYFFRKPIFEVQNVPGNVLSPAWGKITSIEHLSETPESASSVQISIFLSVFDVHLQCMPFDGIIESVQYKEGKFVNALNSESGECNEKNTLKIVHSESGQKINVSQIAGLIARRIVCWVKPEDTLKAGKYFGLIQFGSRVDIRLPGDTVILVKTGQRVNGGKTVLGKISKENQ